VSAFDDDLDMKAHQDELLLRGRPMPSEPELAAFVSALRSTAAEPAPAPNLALAALLRDGLAPPSAGPTRVRPAAAREQSRLRTRLRAVAGLGLAAKIVLGAGVAVASVTGAATIDAVPDVVQRPASAVVSGVVHLFEPAAAPVKHAPARPAPQPGSTAAPTPGPGATAPAPTSAPSAPAVAPSPTPTLPVPLPVDPHVDLPVPVHPSAVPPVVRDLHSLLTTTADPATAPTAEVLAPVLGQ
jgi:hypothetical protein